MVNPNLLSWSAATNCIVLPYEAAAAAPSPPKRRAPIYRRWHLSDERRILTELAAERRRSGQLPSVSRLLQTLQDDQQLNPTARDLAHKVYRLKAEFIRAINSGGPRHNPRDQMLYNLSVEVWPHLLQPVLI